MLCMDNQHVYSTGLEGSPPGGQIFMPTNAPDGRFLHLATRPLYEIILPRFSDTLHADALTAWVSRWFRTRRRNTTSALLLLRKRTPLPADGHFYLR